MIPLTPLKAYRIKTLWQPLSKVVLFFKHRPNQYMTGYWTQSNKS